MTQAAFASPHATKAAATARMVQQQPSAESGEGTKESGKFGSLSLSLSLSLFLYLSFILSDSSFMEIKIS